jgi:hypothetical protein
MDQLVLLCVDYVCVKQGILLPWDAVARQVNDTLTGEAIKQHLAKIVKYREQEGHKIPPKLTRNDRRLVSKAAHAAANGGSSRAGTEDSGSPASTKTGQSLLYKKPTSSKRSSRKCESVASTPRTPATKRGGGNNNNRRGVQASVSHEDGDDSDGEFGKPKPKQARRAGNKRSRASRELEDLQQMSPTKSAKTDGYFRTTTTVNYAEQMAPDDDEDTFSDDQNDGEYADDPTPPQGSSGPRQGMIASGLRC